MQSRDWIMAAVFALGLVCGWAAKPSEPDAPSDARWEQAYLDERDWRIDVQGHLRKSLDQWHTAMREKWELEREVKHLKDRIEVERRARWKGDAE